MSALKKMLFSSIGKKYIMAVSGLGLVGFLVTHLAANLTLLTGNPDLINAYGAGLKSTLGPLFYPAEFALTGLFLVHIAMAVYINVVEKRAARPEKYSKAQRGKGGPSKFGIAGSNMLITGALLAFFLVIHIYQIRYQTEFGTQLMTTINGEPVADLYRYCNELFASPLMTAFYVGVMIFLGIHLRHGFWSAVQSLGAMKPEWSKPIHGLALIIAILFAIAFLIIPIWMHFGMAARLFQ